MSSNTQLSCRWSWLCWSVMISMMTTMIIMKHFFSGETHIRSTFPGWAQYGRDNRAQMRHQVGQLYVFFNIIITKMRSDFALLQVQEDKIFLLKYIFFSQEPRTFPWLCSQWSSDCAGISSSLFERRKMHKMMVMVMMATFQIGPLDLRSTPWRTYISRWGPVRFPNPLAYQVRPKQMFRNHNLSFLEFL